MSTVAGAAARPGRWRACQAVMRRHACRAAMRRHTPESGLRVVPGEHTGRSGIGTGRMLPAERDRGLPLPTAVLVGNDRLRWAC